MADNIDLEAVAARREATDPGMGIPRFGGAGSDTQIKGAGNSAAAEHPFGGGGANQAAAVPG